MLSAENHSAQADEPQVELQQHNDFIYALANVMQAARVAADNMLPQDVDMLEVQLGGETGCAEEVN